MTWPELLAGLEAGRQQLDRVADRACTEGVAPQIYCQQGCSNCCSLAVNCSFPEAAAVAQALSPEQRDKLSKKLPALQQISEQAQDLKSFLRLFRQQLGGCPFLDDAGSCTIYPLRPYSCRALLSTRNSSWCAVDFAELHVLEKEAFLSSLDPEVVAFPTHYLAATQELGLELEAQSLVAMRDAFGVAISGNLLYQVGLEVQFSLSDVAPSGFAEMRTFLEERQLDRSFLLQLQGGP